MKLTPYWWWYSPKKKILNLLILHLIFTAIINIYATLTLLHLNLFNIGKSYSISSNIKI